MHAPLDLTGIAIVALAALGCGLLFTRFKQPAILGYVIAGIVLGPSGFSMIEDRENVTLLAELGVLLLLFILGLELNLRSFREIWKVSVGCVLLQVVASTGMVFLASFVFGWSVGTSLLFGFVIALSSTAVSVTMLESMGELKSATGRLTIGILIAQDLAFVPMTLLIRSFGDEGFALITIGKLILALSILVVLILYLSRKERVHIPLIERAAHHRDLFPLLGLAFCFGSAALSGLLDVSAAYGAFLAGLVLGNTAERQNIIKVTHPTQSILLMMFFLSIGLLLDVTYLWQNLVKVLTLLFIVFLSKTALNVFLLRALKQPFATAFLSSLMLAQIGEFSFVLTTIGVEANLLDAESSRLVIALTVLSLLLSPLWMGAARRLRENQKSIKGWGQAWTAARIKIKEEDDA